MPSKNKERLSQEDIKARLMFLIGSVLSFVFLIVAIGITYALIFVTQTIGAQAPTDAFQWPQRQTQIRIRKSHRKAIVRQRHAVIKA